MESCIDRSCVLHANYTIQYRKICPILHIHRTLGLQADYDNHHFLHHVFFTSDSDLVNSPLPTSVLAVT